MKKEKMGSDPLAWIKDSKQDNQDNSGVSTLPRPQDNTSNLDKIDQQENQSKQSKHDNIDQQENITQLENTENLSIHKVQSLSVGQENHNLQENIDKTELPSKQDKPTKSRGLSDGWTRATFIMKEENLEKLKDLAYWERLQIKEVMNNILNEYFDRKVVQQRPDGR